MKTEVLIPDILALSRDILYAGLGLATLRSDEQYSAIIDMSFFIHYGKTKHDQEPLMSFADFKNNYIEKILEPMMSKEWEPTFRYSPEFHSRLVLNFSLHLHYIYQEIQTMFIENPLHLSYPPRLSDYLLDKDRTATMLSRLQETNLIRQLRLVMRTVGWDCDQYFGASNYHSNCLIFHKPVMYHITGRTENAYILVYLPNRLLAGIPDLHTLS